jgi:hypothetical protein
MASPFRTSHFRHEAVQRPFIHPDWEECDDRAVAGAAKRAPTAETIPLAARFAGSDISRRSGAITAALAVAPDPDCDHAPGLIVVMGWSN